MTFEFVIVYQQENGRPIREVLVERIDGVLMDNLNQFEFDAVDRMVSINYERVPTDGDGNPVAGVTRRLLGFSLELPDETASPQIVIDEFADALLEAPIEHVLKFEDPLLQTELAQRAAELFPLEMKLRRVLSVIYLNAYQDQPYNLLRDETVKPMNPATEEIMKKTAENEFFFLTFGQYVGLNQRPDLTKMVTLVDLIRIKETYEALRTEIERMPVEDEDDKDFLASLKARMNAIEVMRNCVAHSRRPSNTATNNYLNARPQLEKALDEFLARWTLAWQDSISVEEMMEESPEDKAAREAVESALEHAKWDEETKTITIYDPDDDRIRQVAGTREELEEDLQSIAENAYYANVSSDMAGSCHGSDYVQEVLETMEERLEKFFTPDEEQESEAEKSEQIKESIAEYLKKTEEGK